MPHKTSVSVFLKQAQESFLTVSGRQAGVSPHYLHLSKGKLPPPQSVWGFSNAISFTYATIFAISSSEKICYETVMPETSRPSESILSADKASVGAGACPPPASNTISLSHQTP